MKTGKFLPILIILFITISCKKTDEIAISETNLTICDDNSDCTYSFTLPSDIDSTNKLKQGSFRIFYLTQTFKDYDLRRFLYIKAPSQGDSFQLNNRDIISGGKVILNLYCPACYYQAAYKPIGGLVKGVNLTPKKPANQTKWLLDAQIILGGIPDDKGNYQYKDTVNIKQYFYPDFN